jgi:hypothetical protein
VKLEIGKNATNVTSLGGVIVPEPGNSAVHLDHLVSRVRVDDNGVINKADWGLG